MATVLRSWSYQHQWLYDTISRLAALAVGGERRFHHLPLQNLNISHETKILDLCCGGGQATRFLVEYSQDVTGLDVSPLSLERAKRNVPQAKYVEGLAEEMPLPDHHFDLVHISVALHEMPPEILRKIIKEAYRVLKPGGIFTLMDFHKPTNWLFWPGVAIFLWLFETETAWQLLEEDLVELLKEAGFKLSEHCLYAGGSLQVIQVRK
ncbi:MAG TPA: SAM-dependent methyltransferase [Cyanobacteria bacterium UBA11149]|nr:SAM-dependent methyltransferase [Cyanobacteria bacterium UBA11367]HBE59705.1 SAM-dependent methyltransferase [Cyanobacteria bacterium UBA11366]HBK63248.1 SAM-dependent methyltransferase [Cyanobacteria bacterium UBA11166]HBR76584.1 SAM-dependent methyltransferase [Cyanobacteria bacterium UBA11159]HBW88482.1 SAM-dependent methyltransferase [Cyanobacteria bacterium UBA11149]HCA94319.1 SAM-dependent methyltransferase [Cyanobacteria bacterium UBA9226]